MLAAVMEKRMGLALANHDIFVNTVGGVRMDDPGVDLAVIAALASSFVDRSQPADLVIIGEVGLTGEVRAVSQAAARVREAARLGFKRIVLPAGASGVFLGFYGPREAASCIGEEWYESRQAALDACRRRFQVPEDAWRPAD